jgi:mRNA-degrading endonuclease YafQ of YafQ-DinJ toxin-antitoxin module
VKRVLLRSNVFIRAAKRLIKKNTPAAIQLQITLKLLEEDAFHPSLKTHKLKGAYEGSWACSVGYDVRIIFEFVQYEGREAILLQTAGTHDEVY